MLKVSIACFTGLLLLLLFACSGGDDRDSSPTLPKVQPSNAEQSPTPSQDEELHAVAVAFFNAWYAMDFATMADLIDPRTITPPELQPGVTLAPSRIHPSYNLCIFANTVCPYYPGDQSRYPSEWPESALCSGTDAYGNIPASFPCERREITNLAETSGCRDASPAEAANGYGIRCYYYFGFAVRPSGSGVDFEDATHCVVVQSTTSKPIVLQTSNRGDCRV